VRYVSNMQEIEDFLDENDELVIRKNNQNDMIIMSMEEYKEKLLKEKIEKSLAESEEDIKNGRVKDAAVVFEEWKVRYEV